MVFRPTTAVALALAVSCAKRAPPTSAPIDAASVAVTPTPVLASDEALDPIPFDPLAKALTKGVRDLDAACAADDAPACAKLGVWLLEGERLPENARSAAARFQRGCDRGHVHSCALLGTLYTFGVGVAESAAHGIHLLERSCDDGDGDACARVGEEHRTGERLPVDSARARAYLERGVKRGSVRAVVDLLDVDTEETGSRNSAPVLARRAEFVTVATAACDGGDGAACGSLVMSAGQTIPYTPYRYVPSSTNEAIRARARIRGCELGELSLCETLSDAGAGTLETLCARGDGAACARRPTLGFDGPSGPLALCRAGVPSACRVTACHIPSHVDALRAACVVGVVDACTTLLRCPEEDKSVVLRGLDAVRETACANGDATSCMTIARSRGSNDAGASGDVVAMYERACPAFPVHSQLADRDPEACVALARAYVRGDGVARDPAHAVEILRRTCYARWRQWDLTRACIALAEMYDAGDGVPRDPERATYTYAVACSLLSKSACPELARRFDLGIGGPVDRERAEKIRSGALKGFAGFGPQGGDLK